jgi:hypothetical protein
MPILSTPARRRSLSRPLVFVCAIALAAGTLLAGWHGDDTPEAWRTVVSDVDDEGQSVGRLVRTAHARRDADRGDRFVDSRAGTRTTPEGSPAILATATVLDLSWSHVAVGRTPAPPALPRSTSTSSRAPPALLPSVV